MNKMVSPSFADAPNPAVQPRPARIVDFARCMSEAAGAVRLLDRQKFDIVISDPQLGDQCGPILDAVGLSASNRTAVTFAINGSDADASATFRRRTGFVFGRPLSPQSIRITLRLAYGLILRERRRYF